MSREEKQSRSRLVFSSDQVSGRDSNGSSLMPMLVAGLVLIAIGYAAIMIFV